MTVCPAAHYVLSEAGAQSWCNEEKAEPPFISGTSLLVIILSPPLRLLLLLLFTPDIGPFLKIQIAPKILEVNHSGLFNTFGAALIKQARRTRNLLRSASR